MNEESYLKRFFIEEYNDVEKYYEYLKGNIDIDKEIHSKWLKSMKYKNNLFADSLDEFNRLEWNDVVLESALSDDLSISKWLNQKSIVTTSEFEKFKIQSNDLGDSNAHYICNGYFNDTLEQIYRVLNNGSFTVGICSEVKSKLFNEVVEHYEKLKQFLFKNGFKAISLHTNISSYNKVYLLMYDNNKYGGKR